jgi:hypothetical protein
MGLKLEVPLALSQGAFGPKDALADPLSIHATDPYDANGSRRRGCGNGCYGLIFMEKAAH